MAGKGVSVPDVDYVIFERSNPIATERRLCTFVHVGVTSGPTATAGTSSAGAVGVSAASVFASASSNPLDFTPGAVLAGQGEDLCGARLPVKSAARHSEEK